MEKSRTIHIINLGHYLENTPFAQDLLKHNMEMEPNMEWKIWTEKDPEVQEGIKSSVTITLSKEMKAAIEANQTPIPTLPLPNPPQRKKIYCIISTREL